MNVYSMPGCRMTGNVYIMMGNYLGINVQRFFDSDDLSQPGVSTIPYRLVYARVFLLRMATIRSIPDPNRPRNDTIN